MYKVLHDQTSSHYTDKIYIVGIEKTDTGYSVFVVYGRRGYRLEKHIKGFHNTLTGAELELDMHVRKKSKHSNKRCYVDVDSREYSGPVTRSSSHVTDYLPPKTMQGTEIMIKEPVVEEPEVIEMDEDNLQVAVCLDNSGMKGFEIGLDYIVLELKGKTMIVMDMEDNKVEVFKSKFGPVSFLA